MVNGDFLPANWNNSVDSVVDIFEPRLGLKNFTVVDVETLAGSWTFENPRMSYKRVDLEIKHKNKQKTKSSHSLYSDDSKLTSASYPGGILVYWIISPLKFTQFTSTFLLEVFLNFTKLRMFDSFDFNIFTSLHCNFSLRNIFEWTLQVINIFSV